MVQDFIIVRDGSAGGVDDADYLSALTDEFSFVDLDSFTDEMRNTDEPFRHEVLENAIIQVNEVSDTVGSVLIVGWHPDEPGLLIAAPKTWWEGVDHGVAEA